MEIISEGTRIGSKVVLKEAHFGLQPGDIAVITEIKNQASAKITAPHLPAEGISVPLCDLRRVRTREPERMVYSII